MITFKDNNENMKFATFRAENYLGIEGNQYSKFVITEIEDCPENLYGYCLSYKVKEVEIYTLKENDEHLDQMISINFEDQMSILIECTNSLNGSIKLYFVHQSSQLSKERKDKLIKTASFHN